MNEREIVMLARALIAGPASDARALLGSAPAVGDRISPACAWLLGDALAHAWPALWRRGGTAPGASLDGGAVRRGRIWERHAPVGLAFSVATLHLLRMLLAGRRGARALDRGPALTIGDQVMVYLALDAAAGTPAQSELAADPVVRAAPLAWLGFADVLAPGPPEPPEFASLCHGAGALVVESLAAELARRWAAIERSKPGFESPQALIALGAAQDATLRGFLAACDHHRRRDLASFVIDAAAPLLQRGTAPRPAPRPALLDPASSLSTRAAARVAAGALLRAVQVWATWDRAHRGVRFIDDDYPAAQLLLARFEAIQASGAARAAAWLADLAALAPTTPPSAGTVDGP
jgi:hypothetical protein